MKMKLRKMMAVKAMTINREKLLIITSAKVVQVYMMGASHCLLKKLIRKKRNKCT